MDNFTNNGAAIGPILVGSSQAGTSPETAEQTSSISSPLLIKLLEATKAVELAGSTDKMLKQVADSVLTLVPGDASAVALLDPARSWVRTVAGGPAGEHLNGYRLSTQEIKGLLEVALIDERTVTMNDCMADEYAEVYRIARLGRGIAVPLRRQGQVVGVLAVFRQVPEGTAFLDRECRLLELFCVQTGPLLAANQKIAELEMALKSRDEFLSIASHDLRNPLTALRGFSQLTARTIDRTPPEQPISRQTMQTNLQRIIKQSNSLDKLIGKLLDVSRINTGRLEIQPEPLELGELTRETAERCIIAMTTTENESNVPSEQRHHVHLDITSEPLWGQFDRERITQLITNLLDNAFKYSPEGGPLNLSLVHRADNQAELRVSDKGLGIPEEKQSVIFNRWSRVYSPREGEVGEVNGLGLGLFICREIVRKHGGQIDLESVPGQGSTFRVNLPLDAGAGA